MTLEKVQAKELLRCSLGCPGKHATIQHCKGWIHTLFEVFYLAPHRSLAHFDLLGSILVGGNVPWIWWEQCHFDSMGAIPRHLLGVMSFWFVGNDVAMFAGSNGSKSNNIVWFHFNLAMIVYKMKVLIFGVTDMCLASMSPHKCRVGLGLCAVVIF